MMKLVLRPLFFNFSFLPMNSSDKKVYSEEIEIKPEKLELLHPSTYLTKSIASNKTNFEILSILPTSRIRLSSHSDINVLMTKRNQFEDEDKTFRTIEIEDNLVRSLFITDKLDQEVLAGSISNFFKTISDGIFLKKGESKHDQFKDKNIFILEINSEEADKKKQELNEIIDGLISAKLTVIETKKVNETSMKYVDEYMRVGRIVSQEKETSEVLKLINTIKKGGISPFTNPGTSLNFDNVTFEHDLYDFPFVFVCASSGTGKTQLPFSLNIPMLYFLGNPKVGDGKDTQ
ncbi:MAG: hypothetical protein ACRC34_01400, partial [Cetobacterium sp.]